MTIQLPSYDWFFEAKVNGYKSRKTRYSGSYGCDPQLGSLNSTTMNFVVEVKSGEDGDTFLATHYVQHPWYHKPLKDEPITRSFPGNAEGLQECTKWLNEEAKQFDQTK
ncbi:MAG: hypothetical protein HUJ57_05655 [Erysipelotrichaceae bacterium]|nr:hypothetical protein [Erysipelotrichaceae bacterium]